MNEFQRPELHIQTPEQVIEHDVRTEFYQNREMYQLPGDPSLTDKDLDRYVDTREVGIEVDSQFIQNGLEDNHFGVRSRAAGLIGSAPEADQAKFRAQVVSIIKKALEDDKWQVRLSAIELIGFSPEVDRTALIQKGLEDNDFGVRSCAAELIDSAPETDRTALIQKGLEDENLRSLVAKFIGFISDNERLHFLKDIPGLLDELKELATQTPLYKNQPKEFFRKQFSKTGSGTTLVDKIPGTDDRTLREQLIIRHIRVESLFSWRQAYESTEFWKEHGFDYVPIEPIVKVGFDQKKQLVNVFTRVLSGPSVATWFKQTSLYRSHIQEQVNKITQALEELRVEHGHPHDDNFVVMFERDENGEVQLEKIPRVYMIDFDQAVSPEE